MPGSVRRRRGLGLEALSRGAADCLFVESRREPARMLRSVLADWSMRGSVELADAIEWIERAAAGKQAPVDIVFLDPPFGTGLGVRCCKLLAGKGWLADNCRLYLESHKRDPLPELPSELEIVRETVVGDVRMMLAGWSNKA